MGEAHSSVSRAGNLNLTWRCVAREVKCTFCICICKIHTLEKILICQCVALKYYTYDPWHCERAVPKPGYVRHVACCGMRRHWATGLPFPNMDSFGFRLRFVFLLRAFCNRARCVIKLHCLATRAGHVVWHHKS